MTAMKSAGREKLDHVFGLQTATTGTRVYTGPSSEKPARYLSASTEINKDANMKIYLGY